MMEENSLLNHAITVQGDNGELKSWYHNHTTSTIQCLDTQELCSGINEHFSYSYFLYAS